MSSKIQFQHLCHCHTKRYHTMATGGSKKGSVWPHPNFLCGANKKKGKIFDGNTMVKKKDTLRLVSLYPTASQSKPYHLGKKFLLFLLEYCRVKLLTNSQSYSQNRFRGGHLPCLSVWVATTNISRRVLMWFGSFIKSEAWHSRWAYFQTSLSPGLHSYLFLMNGCSKLV